MNYIASLRNALNCSLTEFGSLLDISFSTISRAENSMSLLPLKCTHALLAIQLGMGEADKIVGTGEPESETFDTLEIDQIARRNFDISLQISRLQSQLIQMKEGFRASRRAYTCLNNVLANPGKMDKEQIYWIEGQMAKQKDGMRKNGLMARYQIEIKIAKLQEEFRLNSSYTNLLS